MAAEAGFDRPRAAPVIAPEEGDGPRARRAAALVAAAYALLALAWLFGGPPFSAPDEWSHHLRAIGVGRGELVGAPAAWPIPPDAKPLQRLQTTWANQALRAVRVPAGQSPVGFDCNATRPRASAACVDRVRVPARERIQLTPVGTYPPLAYVLPGLALRAAGDSQSANRLARLASAAPCVGLLAIAAFALVAGGEWRGGLVGLLLAVTPMVVFLGASLNGSGLEVAAAVAYVAALTRLARPEPAPVSVWAAAGASGALLALGRSTGAAWVVLLTLSLAAALGARRLAHAAARGRRAAVFAAASVGLGIAGNRWWEHAYGPVVEVGPPSGDDLLGALALLPSVLRQQVGVFGTLDTVLPAAAYATWLGLVAAVVALAWTRGSARERFGVAAIAIALGAAVPVLLQAIVLVHTGFAVQGRHVLPLAVALPIASAAIALRPRIGGAPLDRVLAGLAGGGAAAVHLVAWLWNARRHAVGIDGPLWFFSVAEWSPPLGWWPWAALAVAGATALLLAGLGAARADSEPGEVPAGGAGC